ncbi:MAG: DUF4079 family protein [Deltaproteobacteria bacterium]|nr:MAG: DUF4079 family protein [Deltaproteobacteria bacterium]
MLLGWAHPAAGAVTILLAARGATLGLRGRAGRRGAEHYRARHATFMPWVYGLVLVSWAGGLASIWALRDDLAPAASGHFAVGTAIVALFSAAALVSRWIATDARARAIHPWIGAAALLLCGVQVFLGLQIMPH